MGGGAYDDVDGDGGPVLCFDRIGGKGDDGVVRQGNFVGLVEGGEVGVVEEAALGMC